jgi:hypothetical protein
MAADAPRTWVLTGSPENHAATASHAFTAIGPRERRRNQAPRMDAGDRIVLHLTRVMRFACQRQPGTVSDGDAALLVDRMHAAAGVPA